MLPEREAPIALGMERIGKPPEMSLTGAVTIDDVRAAAARLEGVAVRTPTLRAAVLEELTGAARVWLKCENLQRINAFKFRGAYNAMAQVPEGVGVVAYSSGNHAQAVALAAKLLGMRAVVVMPSDAPSVKLACTKALLADAAARSRVVEYDPKETRREELGARIAADEGLEIVRPYDDPRVIAGQGTAALELFEDAEGPVERVFVPCGGGGLLSGCAVTARAVASGCKVIGVEPANADDAAKSFASGVLHAVENPETIADGARTPYLGRYTFALVRAHVDDLVTVSDAKLIEAVRFAASELKLVVEPTGVLGLARLMEMRDELAGQRVGVVLTGGNIEPRMFAELMGAIR